jgi:hypothetical protein
MSQFNFNNSGSNNFKSYQPNMSGFNPQQMQNVPNMMGQTGNFPMGYNTNSNYNNGMSNMNHHMMPN